MSNNPDDLKQQIADLKARVEMLESLVKLMEMQRAPQSVPFYPFPQPQPSPVYPAPGPYPGFGDPYWYTRITTGGRMMDGPTRWQDYAAQ